LNNPVRPENVLVNRNFPFGSNMADTFALIKKTYLNEKAFYLNLHLYFFLHQFWPVARHFFSPSPQDIQ